MFLSSLQAVGLADLLDIALVAVLIYALLVWFKRARAATVAKGMLVVAAIYFFSRTTGMVMTTGIFHAFFAILVVALVVIFQEELRSVFERIAIFATRGTAAPSTTSKHSDMLVRSMSDLATERIGALVVLRGKDPLERHLEGGWDVHGEVSEPLLKSIFDFHSMGHDGAVIIEGGRLTRFGAHLPLSKDFSKTAKLGTRHSAALGLVELTDALAIVVSEERGTISVAQDGRIETLRGPQQLEKRIDEFLGSTQPKPHRDAVKAFMERNSREKVLAVVASVMLWVLFVLGAKNWRQAYEVAAAVHGLPSGMSVVRVEPEKIRVVFSGQMRDFYWFDDEEVAVRLDLAQAGRGVNRVRLSDEDVIRPARFRLEQIDPLSVEVDLSGPSGGTPRRQQ